MRRPARPPSWTLAALLAGSVACGSNPPEPTEATDLHRPPVVTSPVTLVDEATVLSVLPRSTELLMFVRSPRWLHDTLAWSTVGPGLVDPGDGSPPLTRLGDVDLASLVSWSNAGIDLDAPMALALIDARSMTVGLAVGLRDRERFAATIGAVSRSMSPPWTTETRAGATLVGDPEDATWTLVFREGFAVFVAGGDAARTAAELGAGSKVGSIAKDPGFVAFAQSLPTPAELFVYGDVAGLIDDWGPQRAGPRHPILGSLSTAGLAFSVEGAEINVRGRMVVEQDALLRRALRPPASASTPGWVERLARAPLGVAVHLAPKTLPEVAMAGWMFSRRPEEAEAVLEGELGADVQRKLLPHLSGELVLLGGSEPAPSNPNGPARGVAAAWLSTPHPDASRALATSLGAAPLFAGSEPDRLFFAFEEKSVLLSTEDPKGGSRLLDVGRPLDPLEARIHAFLSSQSGSPVCAVFDPATFGYLDAPFHYASLEVPTPPIAASGRSAAYRKKELELYQLERVALELWRKAERLDMSFVLQSLAEMGRLAICARSAPHGLDLFGRLSTSAKGPAALLTSWVSLREEQRAALGETMHELQALETKRWQLRDELEAAASKP